MGPGAPPLSRSLGTRLSTVSAFGPHLVVVPCGCAYSIANGIQIAVFTPLFTLYSSTPRRIRQRRQSHTHTIRLRDSQTPRTRARTQVATKPSHLSHTAHAIHRTLCASALSLLSAICMCAPRCVSASLYKPPRARAGRSAAALARSKVKHPSPLHHHHRHHSANNHNVHRQSHPQSLCVTITTSHAVHHHRPLPSSPSWAESCRRLMGARA